MSTKKKDTEKTKKQLLAEVKKLRTKVGELNRKLLREEVASSRFENLHEMTNSFFDKVLPR